MAKKKKYTVGSTALSTIGSAVVAMIFISLLVISLGTISENTIWVTIVQAFCLLIFVALVYSPSWYCGDHDQNSVQFGRMEENLNKGLGIGLVADIPFALTPILLVIGKLGLVPELFPNLLGAIYRILNIHLLYAINAVIPPDLPLVEMSWGQIAGVWCFHLIIPLAAFIGYRLGFRHISISEHLVFQKQGKTDKKGK